MDRTTVSLPMPPSRKDDNNRDSLHGQAQTASESTQHKDDHSGVDEHGQAETALESTPTKVMGEASSGVGSQGQEENALLPQAVKEEDITQNPAINQPMSQPPLSPPPSARPSMETLPRWSIAAQGLNPTGEQQAELMNNRISFGSKKASDRFKMTMVVAGLMPKSEKPGPYSSETESGGTPNGDSGVLPQVSRGSTEGVSRRSTVESGSDFAAGEGAPSESAPPARARWGRVVRKKSTGGSAMSEAEKGMPPELLKVLSMKRAGERQLYVCPKRMERKMLEDEQERKRAMYRGVKGKVTYLVDSLHAVKWNLPYVRQSAELALPLMQKMTSQARELSQPLVLWVTYRLQWLSTCADIRVWALVLVLISCAIITTGGVIYRFAANTRWAVATFKVYGILFNAPGISVVEEESFLEGIVVNIFYCVGIFVFAVFLGMSSEQVSLKIEALRSGISRHFEDHILVLNTNDNASMVLNQMLLATTMNSNHMLYGRTIVLLADLPKEDLDAIVKEAMEGIVASKVEIHTRSGRPYSIPDLESVCAGEAKYVLSLYPHPDLQDLESLNTANANLAATVSALATCIKSGKTYLSIQGPSDMPSQIEHMHIMTDLLDGHPNMVLTAANISEEKIAERLVAQTALQPGIFNVFEAGSTVGGSFGIRWIDVTEEMHGLTYTELRRSFLDTCFMGYWSPRGVQHSEIPNWPIQMHPQGDIIMETGDRIMVLVNKTGDAVLHDDGVSVRLDPSTKPDPKFYNSVAKQAVQRVSSMSWTTKSVQGLQRNLLIIGWPQEQLKELLAGIKGFAPSGTQVTLLLDRIPDNPEQTIGGIIIKYLQTRVTMSLDNLIFGGIEHADTVVIGTPPGLDYPYSDGLVLTTLIQVQRAVSKLKLKHNIHVVARAKSVNTKMVAEEFLRSIANCQVTFEFVMPHLLTSPMLVQTMLDPLTLYIIAEIMVLGAGNELYNLDLAQLGLRPGERVLFAEIVETGQLLDMSVIGYTQANGLHPVLCPPQDCYVELQLGDRIVVLADLVEQR